MSNTTCTPDDCLDRGPRGGMCKACQKADALRRYYANREARNVYNKAWREANPGRVKLNNARWYAEHSDDEAAKYLEQREGLREYYRKRRAANPGGETHHSTAWRKANPERWALRNRENQRRRRGEKPVSYAAILERDGMVCHLCSGLIAGLDDLHMDHVIPLARGGEHNEENIKPAHALCNMRKGSRVA